MIEDNDEEWLVSRLIHYALNLASLQRLEGVAGARTILHER